MEIREGKVLREWSGEQVIVGRKDTLNAGVECEWRHHLIYKL